MEGIFNKVPFLTFLTFVSYVTYFSYKAGESLFYGNPISLIQVDFITLIFTLLRVSIILMLLAFIAWFFIATDSRFLSSTQVSVFALAIVNAFEFINGNDFRFKSFIISVAVYVVVYGFSHFAKDLVLRECSLKDKKYSILGFSISLVTISFFSGNYFGPSFQILKDTDGNVIISEYKDGFLSMKCHSDWSKSFAVIDLKEKVLTTVDKDYLVRMNLVGECNPNIKFK